MDRVLDRNIVACVERMQRAGMDVGLDGAYGRFRVSNRSGSCSLSPRVPNRQILDWLDAYEQGWNARKKVKV